MKWLTIKINPPEKVAPIATKKNPFGWGNSYQVHNLDSEIFSVEEQLMIIKEDSYTHWKYLENEDVD